MNGSRLRTLRIASALAATLFASVTALAEGKRAAKPDTGAAPAKATAAAADDDTPKAARRDPDNITAPSEFTITCFQGSRQYLAGDYPAAIKLFRSAIELNPKNPLGYYYLGEAQLASGNIDAAETAFRQAELSADSRHPDIRAHVLFVIADVLERQKRWPAAREAWQAYLEWVGKYPDAGVFPASGTSRIQAIDAAAKQDKAYDIVRKRIAETSHGNVFTEVKPDSSGAKPAKP